MVVFVKVIYVLSPQDPPAPRSVMAKENCCCLIKINPPSYFQLQCRFQWPNDFLESTVFYLSTKMVSLKENKKVHVSINRYINM